METIRHIVPEGRCFVLSVNQYVHRSMYSEDLACYGDLKDQSEHMCPGGNAIVDPLGQYAAGPVRNREDILFGVVGHHARSDVPRLVVNEDPLESVTFLEETGSPEFPAGKDRSGD